MREKLTAAFMALLYCATVAWRIHVHVTPPELMWWAWFCVHEFLLGCTVWLLTTYRRRK